MWRMYNSILNLDTRQSQAVSFTSRALHPWGMSSWYPLNRRLAGTKNRSAQDWEEKRFLPLSGIEPIGRLPRNPVTITNTLSRRTIQSHPCLTTLRFVKRVGPCFCIFPFTPTYERHMVIRYLNGFHVLLTKVSTPEMYRVGDESIGRIGELILSRNNRSTRRKACPSATLSTTNPTRSGLELNPCHHGWKVGD
jgi:hypothetical protein